MTKKQKNEWLWQLQLAPGSPSWNRKAESILRTVAAEGRKQGIEEMRDAILGELAGTWSQTRERVQAIAQWLLGESDD